MSGAEVAAGVLPRRSEGELKQAILRIYNAVNQDMWRVGVRKQRVDVLDDRLLIVAEHQRVPVLALLDDDHRELTRRVDSIMMEENKARLREELATKLGLRIRTILKDYDPATQLTATVILLDAPPPTVQLAAGGSWSTS